MQLPAQLLRHNLDSHKNQFGHVLILAGSRNMLGAAALSGLAAMRSGSGLVTIGVAKSLNRILQKKISPEIMTLSLNETQKQSISSTAFNQIKDILNKYSTIAIGPGLSQVKSTQNFVFKIIKTVKQSLVLDADALNALSVNISILKETDTLKILTPHPGEMARLTSLSKKEIESNRKAISKEFSAKYNCILVLKGNNTIVACPSGKVYVNKSGNPGMATAGSGDVLTGIISSFLGQGFSGFDACKLGVFLHGKAGDYAAKQKTRISMIAGDIIDSIPNAIKKMGG